MEKKENYELTPKGFLKTISILHLALLSAPLVLGIFSYFNISETKIDYSNTNDIYLFLVPGIAILGILGGNILFEQKINELKERKTLGEKLAEFQTASLIKYALLEGPAFLGIVAFSEEGNLIYLFISGILLILLLYQMPTKLKIESVLNLSNEQQNQFNKTEQPLL